MTAHGVEGMVLVHGRGATACEACRQAHLSALTQAGYSATLAYPAPHFYPNSRRHPITTADVQQAGRTSLQRRNVSSPIQLASLCVYQAQQRACISRLTRLKPGASGFGASSNQEA